MGRMPAVSVASLALALFLALPAAEARVTKITAEPPVVIDLPLFGATGAYLKITGSFEGEIDPADRRNAVITDIDLAPKVGGKVRYKSTFAILRPQSQTAGNHEILYDFGNRGQKHIIEWFNDATPADDPKEAKDFGNGWLMRQGFDVVWSGWDGQARDGHPAMTIALPVAKNKDGSPVTGPVLAEFIPAAADKTKINLPYEAARTAADNGRLTVRQHQTDAPQEVAGWSYANSRAITFPGPAHPQWIYEFVYEAKDPMVMTIGHAATRDFLSFLRYADKDDAGNANPLALPVGTKGRFAEPSGELAHVEAIYGWGRSQGGRVQRDFVRWGFNEDENGRTLFDGMMPYATGSGGNLWMNHRFAQPTVSAQQHSRRFSHEQDLPHTFAVTHDPLTGESDGVLKRCLATGTCPKMFNIDSANEYWNKSASLNHTDAYGTDLDVDALAPDTRLYFIASIQHNTKAYTKAVLARDCQQPVDPLYNGPVFRALAVAMDAWVRFGVTPPPSLVPQARDGTLVPPESLRFPKIPATAYQGWPELPPVQVNPGAMNVNLLLDFSKVPPLPTGKVYATLVPQVDRDGNDMAGIRLPFLAAPLGTFTGWGLLRQDLGGGVPDICQQLGQFIPFANSKAERVKAGDPRLSNEERYPNPGDYVRAVRDAAADLVHRRFLLPEDYDRMVALAMEKGTDLWKVPAGKKAAKEAE
jgi:hypothetical protein